MTTINPYITFNGNCEAAFTFYQSVFGGEIPHMARFKDMPADGGFEVPESDQDKIMHVSLPISEETILMGSDACESFGPGKVQGNNFSISINTDTAEEADRIFAALSEGGTVAMAMNKTFWGSYFGMLTDQFGISWMVSWETGEEQH
jgi:PhnB protein